jgi:hypothetical protein
MKERALQIARGIDPCLIFSILSLAILIPIGFTLDHVKLQTQCAQSPLLYLGDQNNADRIPTPFADFISKATTDVEIILASNHPHGDDNHTNYYVLLKTAADRGVRVNLVTDDLDLFENFTFCSKRYLLKSSTVQMFAYIAQADHKRTIFSSDLLSQYVCPDSRFLLDFPDCTSVANDVSSIFQLLAGVADSGDFPSVFSHASIPGSSFPREHSLPNGGICRLGISPQSLVPPGRSNVSDLMSDVFQKVGKRLSVVTESLFPTPQNASLYMPEMVLSERIEEASLNDTKTRILISTRDYAGSHCQVRSLMQFPNVNIRVFNASVANCTIPALYTFGNASGFMAMPYEQIVRTGNLTFAVHLVDSGLAAVMQDYFDTLWNRSLPLSTVH